jgi:hypothetical protein
LTQFGLWVDVVQTLVLATVAGSVIYVVVRLERALTGALAGLNEVLAQLRDNGKRLDELERRQNHDASPQHHR